MSGLLCALCKGGDEPGRPVLVYPAGNFHVDCKEAASITKRSGRTP